MTGSQAAHLVVRRRVVMTAGPVVRIEHEFDNLGTTERSAFLHQWVHGDGEMATITLPLATGLTHGPWSDFPNSYGSSLSKPDAYAERWAALTFSQATVGLVWGADVVAIYEDMTLSSRPYSCPPRGRVRPEPLHLYVGDGDWRAVRRLWERLGGVPAPAANGIEPAGPLTAHAEPAVAVFDGTTTSITLVAEHRRARPARGRLSLQLPDGWAADRPAFELADLAWGRPARLPIALTAGGEPGSAAGRLLLRTDEGDVDLEIPLLRLGDGSSVVVREGRVAEQPVLTVANGRLEIDVTPGFGGTVSALRTGAVDHLASPFPIPGFCTWLHPWHGGLTPVLLAPGQENFPGPAWRERFVAEPVEVTDGGGITWRGVRQRADAQHETWRGLTLEMETLTVGGSPVVKQVLRLRNATPIARRVTTAGWVAFVQPDGDRRQTTIWGPAHQVKASDRIAWFRTGAWVAAENPLSGRTLILVSPAGRAGLSGWGSEGNHLSLLTDLTVPPSGTAEVIGYLALADDLTAARRYAALARLR
jgi:hypothetical protein